MTQPASNPPASRANTRAALRWGAVVVAMLSLQVGLGVVAIVLATGDESVAVVPDYYEKALRWDDEKTRQEASHDLGWHVGLEAFDRDTPRPGLKIDLRDDSGSPVAIRSGTLRLYAHVRAGSPVTIALDRTMTETSPIEITACFDRGGLWQIELDVTDASGRRFTQSREFLLQWTL